MKVRNKKRQQREIRHRRTRAKATGDANTPRLAVYRSNANIYAQLIDDEKGNTLVSASDLKMEKGSKLDRAMAVGKEIAEKAKEKNIEKVVFDRGGFLYMGRIKALADSAREAGLKF